MPTKNHYAFVIDVTRCIDCRACLVACSVENNVPLKHTRIWVHDQRIQGEWPDLSRAFVPYNCMHCDNPPCTEVCSQRVGVGGPGCLYWLRVLCGCLSVWRAIY